MVILTFLLFRSCLCVVRKNACFVGLTLIIITVVVVFAVIIVVCHYFIPVQSLSAESGGLFLKEIYIIMIIFSCYDNNILFPLSFHFFQHYHCMLTFHAYIFLIDYACA